ncbi:MAG: hypothetical protein A2Y84_01465 [Candidatus Colwellbacteria bacterium RBG_13_48_8]|uniref:Uncharacterized protein n=1 Tax=Candidatus Colwellbacteria bacterium RBG_13_48_8 TaxID=1797685 RepID=A0A1G1YY68_9BACT|nr:MAG: hypothetical protein A2Y84_01465 [Candidatus Colwellbacteria bacterium RBG_13_48_8]
MVERLKLALKNPALPLVLRAGLLAVAVFWLRAGPISGFKAPIFLLVFFIFYLKPNINAGKFWVSTLMLLVIALFAPRVGGLLGLYINAVLGLLIFMLLGVKNLIFLRRQGIYYWLHLILIVGVTGLYFIGNLSPILLFVLLAVLFREFYLVMTNQNSELVNLVATTESMLLTQAAWISSLFPASFLISSSFLMLIAFVMHDLLLNDFKNALSKTIVLRDAIMLAAFCLLALVTPLWGIE